MAALTFTRTGAQVAHVRGRQCGYFPRRSAGNLAVVKPPSPIPRGSMAVYADAGGTTIYVLDQAAGAEPT